MEYKILETSFVAGYTNTKKLPQDKTQVVILGRANVGKSTLVNRLCQRKSLAKTSKTPGRTQEFNFFNITYKKNVLDLKENGANEKKDFYLVDLPGFGFSKFSIKQRNELSKNIIEYLQNSKNISQVLLLNDSRRNPEDDEMAIQRVCFESGILFQVVLTKVDKLKKNDIKKRANEIATIYNLEAQDVILSGEKIAVDTIWERVLNILESEK